MKRQRLVLVLAIAALTLGIAGYNFADVDSLNDKFSQNRGNNSEISSAPLENSNSSNSSEQESLKKATFAGGCFWCIEAIYENRKGIKAAISGYAGGKASTANYKQVSTGETEHREAVRVRYDSSKITYEELLDMYWKSIDPTDDGGQFSDRGPQYTTAIYAHNEIQYQLAKQSKENLSESGKFDEPIVTEIVNYTTFFKAEKKHQNYSQKNTYSYKAYKQASGRKGFVEKLWENSPIN